MTYTHLHTHAHTHTQAHCSIWGCRRSRFCGVLLEHVHDTFARGAYWRGASGEARAAVGRCIRALCERDALVAHSAQGLQLLQEGQRKVRVSEGAERLPGAVARGVTLP